jgi:hypothetical protein
MEVTKLHHIACDLKKKKKKKKKIFVKFEIGNFFKSSLTIHFLRFFFKEISLLVYKDRSVKRTQAISFPWI